MSVLDKIPTEGTDLTYPPGHPLYERQQREQAEVQRTSESIAALRAFHQEPGSPCEITEHVVKRISAVLKEEAAAQMRVKAAQARMEGQAGGRRFAQQSYRG